MVPGTLEWHTRALRRFARYAAAHHVTALHEVDAALAQDFLNAPGLDRHQQLVHVVKSGTKHLRLAAPRAFHAAVLAAGWTDASDPTTGLSVRREKRGLCWFRPLTITEEEQVRFHAGDNPAELRPALVALLLAGVWRDEAVVLASEDFDPESRALRLPESHKHRARTIVLDQEAARIVTARLDQLRAEHGEPLLLFPDTGGSDVRRNTAKMSARTVLNRAGLSHDSKITPTSLTLTAARRAFDATGRVEDAARLLGYTSLDTTAEALGWDWQNDDSSNGGAA